MEKGRAMVDRCAMVDPCRCLRPPRPPEEPHGWPDRDREPELRVSGAHHPVIDATGHVDGPVADPPGAATLQPPAGSSLEG